MKKLKVVGIKDQYPFKCRFGIWRGHDSVYKMRLYWGNFFFYNINLYDLKFHADKLVHMKPQTSLKFDVQVDLIRSCMVYTNYVYNGNLIIVSSILKLIPRNSELYLERIQCDREEEIVLQGYRATAIIIKLSTHYTVAFDELFLLLTSHRKYNTYIKECMRKNLRKL